MSKPDRYGSPYDPRNGGRIAGKIQRDQDEAKEHRLGGCGPECSICNPGRGAGGFTFTIDRDGPFLLTSSMFLSGGEEQSGPNAPASFLRAREKVKDWLLIAPDQTFDDIVGNDAALELLRDAIEAPVKQKALYEAYGLKMPKGALLSGPPGCGKTMFARAAASEMKRLYGGDAEFISIAGGSLQSMYVGQTEGYIKSIFDYAREYRAYKGHPLLVFLDEAEVLLPDRTSRVRRVMPWEESQVATFLAEMDGIRESGAFVLLATNRPEVIDQAVLRDGRCDFKIEVARPTQMAVETILRRVFADAPAGSDDVETLVFAAIEALYAPHQVIVEAKAIMLRLKENGVEVDTRGKHFLLEHIISGAMAAGIPTRAKRHAFARDKAAGVVSGVKSSDVVRAVGDLFDENKGLDHSFALSTFARDFMAELKAEQVSPPPPPRRAGRLMPDLANL